MKKRFLCMILVISTLLSLCCISVYAKAPGVTTLEPNDITEDSAVLRGTVTSNSGIRIKEYGFQLVYQGNVSTYRFYDGKDYEYPNPINNDVIEYEVDGLRDNSEYAIVFYAVNYDGEKNFGKSVYFETDGDDEEPEITRLKSSAGNEFEEGTEVTFSASAEDNNEVEKIYIFIDGEVVAQKSSDSVKYTTDELDPGEYEIAAMAEDASGNKSDVEYLEITVTEKYDGYYNSDYYEDTDDDDYDEDSYIVQQPVKLSTPNAKADRYTIYEGETVTVSWNSVSNADYYTVWDLTRNVPYDNITSTSCYNIAPFNENGIYAIGVYARSYENNLYLQSEACTFNITVVEKEIADTSKPQINTISSSAGKSFSEGTSTTFSTRASDNALSVMYMYIDGEKVETSYYETIEYETSYLDAGNHTIKVVARDESGNESYTSITVTVEEEYEENDDYYDYYGGYTDVSVFHNQAYSDAPYYGGIKVYVNGSQLYFDVEPEIKNERTMVPLRAIFEALGAEVYWNGSTSTVTAYRDNESVELTIGSYYLYTSNGTKTLDQPGYVTNDRTLVPVRAISEAFNCDVEWYGDKQLVSIVAKDKKYQTVISNGNSQRGNSNEHFANPATTMTNALYNININDSKITCHFDSYRNTQGRHEGIDFTYGIGKNVYSLTDGVVTRVTMGKEGSILSTIAIYNKSYNKTIVYLHSAPLTSLYEGQQITKGQLIATESWRGISSKSSAHTHVEVRNGKKTAASVSVGDSTLDNENPTSFWNQVGYEIK